ncbi:CD151 antigen [Bicyclus anynana]|uniref:Tetraspanin n=1 Tax=Bicyclus anynana TaxID=110368 RepID=A0A6J1NAT3_BICAN|nr:CD151 antigen [Bicyclus anynana]XP_023942115.1 CD151 antigen [Bicyclus anynana]XP_052738102.1 CD151 antigen [Bicyclus anynana]XP_052738103.1 CD151 antigen [Bicyclus anynana]XP_052738104.1 CD151 antigen [Bicyclus anynana]XP_052738105.1 CD151 antigen [Bicyclus anynana]
MAEEKKKDSSALLAKKKKVKPRKSRDADCCSVNFLKCVLHIFNVIFLFAGAGVLLVGAGTVASRHRFVPLLPTPTYAAIAYLLIVAGALGLPLSALGCCGLKTENRTSLLCYTYFLLITFLLEAGAGALAYYYEVAVEDELRAELNSTFISNYALDQVITDAVDTMQTEFKCCGATRYSDWRKSAWHEHDPRLLVPDSCCKTVSARCGARDHPSNIYYHGCIRQFTNHIRDNLIILAAVGVGMSVIPIFGFFFSCVLYVKIKHVID